MGHLADGNQGAIDGLDRQIIELVDGFGAVVEQYRVFIGAELGGAHRDDLVLRCQCVAHVLCRQAFGCQGLGVEVEGDLTLFTAHGGRHGQTGQ